jgi:hypothetical protein
VNTLRRRAAIGSILIHLVLLGVLSLIVWKPMPQQHEQVVVELDWAAARPSGTARAEDSRRNQGASRPQKVRPPETALSGQTIVAQDSLLVEAQKDSEPDPERQFFGDSLYTILRRYPELKPIILQELLVRNVQAYDSLAAVKRVIAEALAPYLEMSDAERAARANMKRFGYAQNPYQAPAIPGNIPIGAIVMYLLQLLTR